LIEVQNDERHKELKQSDSVLIGLLTAVNPYSSSAIVIVETAISSGRFERIRFTAEGGFLLIL